MRKSQLLKQNEQLFSKLQFSNLSNKRLINENALLKERVEMLTHKLSILESEKSVSVSENSEISEEVNELDWKTESDEEDLNESIPPVKEEIELSPEMEYGAKTIGEIVMQSVNYSNKVSELGKPNVKELINLILGKTEVAKSEILNITLSDSSLENKFSMMDSQLDDTIEYFKSILEQ